MGVRPDDFQFVSSYVRSRAAIVLEAGKEYLVESRLSPLARAEGLASLDELVTRLRADPGGPLGAKVVEAMTTNETSFFRDLHPFEALRTQILPEILRARANERTLNLWCGASSSGQEPYTIAMLLKEHFPQLAGWRVRFIATDISVEMLRRSRNGVYSQLEVNRGLPARLLVKYFEQHGNEWQIKKELRDMIEFTELNLARPWNGLPVFDVIFMRNVLIYFDVATKREILARVRKQLRPDGVLFLGGSETTLNLDAAFQRTACGATACYKLAA